MALYLKNSLMDPKKGELSWKLKLSTQRLHLLLRHHVHRQIHRLHVIRKRIKAKEGKMKNFYDLDRDEELKERCRIEVMAAILVNKIVKCDN